MAQRYWRFLDRWTPLCLPEKDIARICQIVLLAMRGVLGFTNIVRDLRTMRARASRWLMGMLTASRPGDGEFSRSRNYRKQLCTAAKQRGGPEKLTAFPTLQCRSKESPRKVSEKREYCQSGPETFGNFSL